MKKLSFYFLLSLLISSCGGQYTEIGSLDLLTDRKIDSASNYERLCSGAGSSKRELRKSTAITLQQAIDTLLRQVPGGEYLSNVKIYIVRNNYLAVSGDVWGKSNNLKPSNSNE